MVCSNSPAPTIFPVYRSHAAHPFDAGVLDRADSFTPLAGHDQWRTDLAASRVAHHPGQAGYGLIAWLVLHHGWGPWLQIS